MVVGHTLWGKENEREKALESRQKQVGQRTEGGGKGEDVGCETGITPFIHLEIYII